MGAWRLTDPQIEFVFGRIDEALKGELQAFWLKHLDIYRSEIKAFRAVSGSESSTVNASQRPLLRQPAAISRDANGTIVGIVFVALREIEPCLGLGTHAYFQRMYIEHESRSPRLANRLFKAFLNGFDDSAARRDHRARFLMADNVNPGLHQARMRRYFTRLGFRMLGGNRLGGEVWARKLQTRFVF
jgi:hypothetical protein